MSATLFWVQPITPYLDLFFGGGVQAESFNSWRSTATDTIINFGIEIRPWHWLGIDIFAKYIINPANVQWNYFPPDSGGVSFGAANGLMVPVFSRPSLIFCPSISLYF